MRAVAAMPPADMPAITPSNTLAVELFGAPRLLAKAAAVEVPCSPPAAVLEVLRGLEATCPVLRGRVLKPDGATLIEGFALNVNGSRFVRDLDETLDVGDRLLLFSSAAGG